MTLGLLSGLFGNTSNQVRSNGCGCSVGASTPHGASRFGKLAGSGAAHGLGANAGPWGGLSSALSNLAQGQVNAIGGQTHPGRGGCQGGGASGGLLGGLLGAKVNLLSGLLGGSAGGSYGPGSAGGCGGSSAASGTAAGNLFKSLHATAERAIDAAGLQPAFGPIDAAVVHPLLWDPLSAITGTDVSDHPAGIKDVGYDR